MWGLLIILAGSPMPQPVTWHLSQDACYRQAEVELLHLATNRREIQHIECRSYTLPGARTEVRR